MSATGAGGGGGAVAPPPGRRIRYSGQNIFRGVATTYCEMTAVPGRVAGPARPAAAGRDYPPAGPAADRAFTLVGRPLAHAYGAQIAAFQSFNAPLLAFLKDDAFEYQRAGNTCTTLFFDRESSALVAFCATKCSSVKVKGDSILSLCPAVEISALCVDDRYRFQGVGQAILSHVLNRVQAIRAIAGVELVTLFAVPEAVDFYRKFGFQKLGATGKVLSAAAHSRCVPMYFRLPPAGENGKGKDVQLILFP